MYRAFFTVVAIILAISVLGIGIFKPQMHKKILIFESNNVVAEPQTVTIHEVKLPEKTQKPEKATVKTEQKTVANVQNKVSSTPTQTTTQKTTVQNSTVTKVPTTKTTTAKTSDKQTDIDTKPLIDRIKKQTEKTPEKTETVQTVKQETKPVVEQKTVKLPAVHSSTTAQAEQEELLLWNKWRSDLQNSIMRDTNLPPIPNGTIFRFQFDVDKYGKITNITAWSDTPAYTPYAVNYITPVIRTYQGRSILNFPKGSTRFKTTMVGGWKISNKSVYSSPSDYSDVERIKK